MEQAAWTAQARAYLFAQANLSKGARLLEVGCGTGAVMSSIPASFNQPAHGLDIDFEYLQIAHGLLPALGWSVGTRTGCLITRARSTPALPLLPDVGELP